MIRIETGRLILREHRIDDLDNYHGWISDPKVMKHVVGFPMTNSLEESFVRLSEAIDSRTKNPRVKYYLAIALKETDQLIGSGGGIVKRREESGGIIGIGYFLDQRHWNKGYATEATKAWIDFCFQNLGIHRIVAGCDAENEASEKVLRKCGYEERGRIVTTSLY